MKKFLLLFIMLIVFTNRQLTGMINHACQIRASQYSSDILIYLFLTPIITSRQLLREAWQTIFSAKARRITREQGTQTNRPFTEKNELVNQYTRIMADEERDSATLKSAQQAEKERQEALLQNKIAIRRTQQNHKQNA